MVLVENNFTASSKKASYFEKDFFNSSGTYIHPTAQIGSQVSLGPGVKVGPFCVITGNTTIGAGTRLLAHVTIGYPAQVLGIKESLGVISIGENCEFREFSTVHASRQTDGKTVIGNNCYLMTYCHVGHDCFLEDNVTLTNNTNLGGHTHVEKNVRLMAYTATHQFCRIGQYTALAPFSGIRQDLPPFGLFTGQPAAFAGLNVIGLRRAAFSRESINNLKHVAKLFYQDKLPLEQITHAAAHEQTWGSDEHVQCFLRALTQSSRGVSRRALSDQPYADADTENIL